MVLHGCFRHDCHTVTAVVGWKPSVMVLLLCGGSSHADATAANLAGE